MPMKPEKLTGVKPPPDAEKWHNYGFTMQQETPNRIEDAAKYLAAMISFSLTFTITNLNDVLTVFSHTVWIKLCFGLWLVSFVVTFLVIYPRRYRFPARSADKIRAVHGQIWRYKRFLFIAAVFTYFVPFLVFGILFLWSI